MYTDIPIYNIYWYSNLQVTINVYHLYGLLEKNKIFSLFGHIFVNLLYLVYTESGL